MIAPDSSWTSLLEVHFWQLTVVLLVVAAGVRLFCRRRPHLAYALWMIVLTKAITPPLWMSSLSFFGLTIPATPPWQGEARVVTSALAPQEVNGEQRKTITTVENQGSRLQSTKSISLQNRDIRDGASANRLPAITTIWWIGALLFGLFSLTIVLRRERLLRLTRVATPLEVERAAGRIANKLGLPQTASVVVTSSPLGPAVSGILRPKLILPEALLNEQAARNLEPILTHELVHLQRGDHLVALLQCLVQIVWWFHPLVWWANRKIGILREQCCDQQSVRHLQGPPADYARCLLDVLHTKQQVQPIYGFPGARPAQITAQRIKEIMAMSNSSYGHTPAWMWATAFIAALLALPGASTPLPAATTANQSDQPAPTTGPTRKKPVLLLQHDDGRAEGRKSIAGAGEMIQFEASGKSAKVRGLRVHASRYGRRQPPKEDVEITLLSGDMKEILHTELVPYALFKRTSKARWTHVRFKEAIEVPKKFWVVLNFHAEATKGVYVSYDTSTQGKFSRVGTTDEDAKKTKFNGDWMVRVLLANPEKT